MDVVEDFLAARRAGRVEDAIDLVAENATLSFPWGGRRSGESIKHHLRNEAAFARKEYLSSSVEIKEVAEGTYQRVYKWDKGQYENHNSGLGWFTRLQGGYNLPTYREIYFVRNGKIAHMVNNKDPVDKTLRNLFFHSFNPFATGPTVLLQGTRL